MIIIKPRKLHLLRIEVADFLRNVDNSGKRCVVAFLLPFHIRASSATDFHRQLLAARLPHQLPPGLLLRVLGGARRLVDSLANLRPAPVANFIDRLVALPHRLVERLLRESDGALLVKVLLAHLLGCGREGSDVGVVTGFNVPVIFNVNSQRYYSNKNSDQIEMVSFEPRLNCRQSDGCGWVVARRMGLLSITKIMDKVWPAAISIRGIVFEETVWILFLI